MPYYNEQRGRGVIHSMVDDTPYIIVPETSKAMTYRSRPHADSLTSSEVLDVTADPYAYFLETTSERKYQARLAERGLPSRGAPDRGHSFELSKHIVRLPQHSTTFTSTSSSGPPTVRVHKNACVLPGVPSGQYYDPLWNVHQGGLSVPAPYKGSGLDQFAQQAYNKLAPTSVEFDAAQFLGELREGLPKFSSEAIKSTIRDMKISRNSVASAGSDYLNSAFGWKPFISDLQNAAKALYDATQMLANQGKRVHRSLSLPPTTSAGEVFLRGSALNLQHGGLNGLLDSKGYQALGGPMTGSYSAQIGKADLDYMKVSSSRRWFEGEFTSFFPLGFDPSNFFDRFNQLVKVNPTPSTLWQLAPWSWLVDWFLHVEDTIAANEKVANDLLVMHYGYAMETTVYKTAVTWSNAQTLNYNYSGGYYSRWSESLPAAGQAYAETVYKKRLRANPYGFRIGGSQSLTGGQIAILGALGLTRLK